MTTSDILIRRATINDTDTIARIGRIAVGDAHRASCSHEDMEHYLDTHYNAEAIGQELANAANIYHLLFYKGTPAGFSKIVLDATHPNVALRSTTKLDRIYLLSDYFDLQLGHQLLNENIAFSRQNRQSSMWLFTWTGNERAVNFYKRNGFTVIGDHMFKVSDTHYNPNYHMLLTY